MIAGFAGLAQNRSTSPYSRYGLGELNPNPFARNISMGGLSLALRPENALNIENPASLTALRHTLFTFGFSSHISRLNSTLIPNPPVNNSSALAYVGLGYPITKRWTGAFGLRPFSGVGYSMEQDEYVPQVGNVKYRFDGYGGLNTFFLGNALQFGPVSLGLNAGYLFGKTNRERTNLLPVDSISFNSQASSKLTVGDFTFEAGLQVKKKWAAGTDRDSLQLIVGARYGLPGNLGNTREDLLVELLSPGGTSIDTIYNESRRGTLYLPMSWGMGFSIGQKNQNRQWRVGVDYTAQPWSQYTLFEQKDSLGDAHRLSIGGLYQPKVTSVQWRGGLYLSQTYHNLKGTPIRENGIAFGLGIPIRAGDPLDLSQNLFNYFNFGFVIGERGTTDDLLIKEEFMRFTFGFTFQTMTWFLKRKYD